MQYTDCFIAPAATKVDYISTNKRHYITTSSFTPISGNKSRAHIVITFEFGSIGWFVCLFFNQQTRQSRMSLKSDSSRPRFLTTILAHLTLATALLYGLQNSGYLSGGAIAPAELAWLSTVLVF